MKKILLLFLALAVFAPCSFAEYKVYNGKLKNEVLEVKKVNQNKILIERKKLAPISNVKFYAFCYDYLITNNTGKDIILNNITSADRITLAGAWGRSQVPHGSDFVPGYGIAVAIKTDVEKNRFTRRLPENETIEAGKTLRVLMLAPKKVNHVSTFSFKVNNKNVLMTVK